MVRQFKPHGQLDAFGVLGENKIEVFYIFKDNFFLKILNIT